MSTKWHSIPHLSLMGVKLLTENAFWSFFAISIESIQVQFFRTPAHLFIAVKLYFAVFMKVHIGTVDSIQTWDFPLNTLIIEGGGGAMKIMSHSHETRQVLIIIWVMIVPTVGEVFEKLDSPTLQSLLFTNCEANERAKLITRIKRRQHILQ